MRFSIGVKIFGIAVFLTGVMIVASILSESRVRDAQLRIDVLADHLLDLADQAGDLRILALEEKFEFREIVAAELAGNSEEAERAEQLYEEFFGKFKAIASTMRDEIEQGVLILPTAERKLELTNVRLHLESLVATHDQLHNLMLRIITRHAEGNEVAKAELISLFEEEDKAFLAADEVLTSEIRSVVHSVSLKAQEAEREAIAFEHVVTGSAALLGLLLASFMTRALLLPIRRLRKASMAVREGNFTQRIEIKGNDELAELSDTFNDMIEQLQQKERTEAVFGRYVDPRVIQKLVDDTGENAEDIAAADRQEATIFFSDIAGYTSISERLTPAGLVHLMNEYFNMAGVPISETGGLLDKFIGDAVMAFWSPPFTPADEVARLGCKAAIGEARMMEAFQKRLPDITGIRVGAPKISIRMGLATGEVIVGSIGSSDKRNFTVIGDTVNLSSRLEGANKFYGTQTLICERTHALMGNGFTTREIDNLAVKGKDEAVRIFELVCEGAPAPETAEAFEAFAEGLKLYRQCDWEAAAARFDDCLRAKPDDSPAQVFLKRIELLKSQPPGADWDGVWRLDSK